MNIATRQKCILPFHVLIFLLILNFTYNINANQIDYSDVTLAQIVNQNEQIIYAAMFSLNDKCQKIFSQYSTHSPERLYGLLSDADKQKTITITENHLLELNRKEKSDYLQRLEKWIICWKQINIIVQLKDTESTTNALYGIFQDDKVFTDIVENRHIDPKEIDSDFIGATVATSELALIQYTILNKLSLLSNDELIMKFKSIFEYILNK